MTTPPEHRIADALHHITQQLTENLAAHGLHPVECVRLSIRSPRGSITATASPSTDGTELIWMMQTRSASIEGGPAVEGGRS
ncbi:hypothetical protein [Brevibacterium otitidis]|uniref:Uncharacterized protein n=1 Tax=Brevibacterium otitidis TaxID=53364 RepID=A0ABV5X385_9MICO|nr:hypothetical protein GCM10023233_27480 [Brevibacterium otitidis]